MKGYIFINEMRLTTFRAIMFELQDYWVYIGLLIVGIFFAIIAEKKNNPFYILFILAAYSVIAGLRDVKVGKDTITYINLFKNIRLDQADYSSIEEGFKIFCKLVMKINHDPQFVLMVIGVVTYALILFRLWDFKEFASYPFMVFAFYTAYYAYSLNAVRQMLSVAIVFWGSRYIFMKKYVQYFVLVVLASFIHTSSLLGFSFLLYAYVTWKDNDILEKLIILISTCTIPFAVSKIFLASRYVRYFGRTVISGYLLYVALIVLFFVSLFYLPFGVKELKNIGSLETSLRKSISMKVVISVFYFVSLCINFLGVFYRYMYRVGLIYAMFGLVYNSMLTKDSKDRKFFFYILAIYYIYLFVTIWMANSHGQIPYRFNWQW